MAALQAFVGVHRMVENAQDTNLVIHDAIENPMLSVTESAQLRTEVIDGSTRQRMAPLQGKGFVEAEEIFGRDIHNKTETTVGQYLVEIGLRWRAELKP